MMHRPELYTQRFELRLRAVYCSFRAEKFPQLKGLLITPIASELDRMDLDRVRERGHQGAG